MNAIFSYHLLPFIFHQFDILCKLWYYTIQDPNLDSQTSDSCVLQQGGKFMKNSSNWINTIQDSLFTEAKKIISDYVDSLNDFDLGTYPENGKSYVALSKMTSSDRFRSLYQHNLFPTERFEDYLKSFGWEYIPCNNTLVAIPAVSSEDEEEDIK